MALSACGGGSGGGSGEGPPQLPRAFLQQIPQAASCSYEHLYITVERVRVLQQSGGGEHWIELPAAAVPRQVDLLNAGGGLLQAIGVGPLAAGQYTQLRLDLAEGDGLNAVQPTGGDLLPLSVPSGAQSGLKLRGDILVPSGQTGDVVLEGFDPCEAVVRAGNSGQYILRPEVAARLQMLGVAGEASIALGILMPLVGAGYVVSRHQPPNTWVVQRFGEDGQPRGGETTITAPMGQDATGASIAPLAGGGYAVVWMTLVEFRRFGGSIYRLNAQSFTATGAPIGSPRDVGETTPAFYWFPRPVALPQVAALAGGGFVVVWGQENGQGGLAIQAQRFNADGTPAGTVHQVAPLGTGYLGVVGLSTGGYLVIWGTFGTLDGGARAYGPDDTPLGPARPAGPSWTDFPVDPGQPAAMAPLAGGGAVIVWLREAFPFVRVVVLAPDATPLAGSRVVDDSTPVTPSNGHSSPAVGALADGGFVVAWIEAGEVHARRFASGGTPAGEETRVNLDTTTTGVEGPITVVALAGGGFMVSWSAVGPDGVRRNYSREFPSAGLLAGP